MRIGYMDGGKPAHQLSSSLRISAPRRRQSVLRQRMDLVAELPESRPQFLDLLFVTLQFGGGHDPVAAFLVQRLHLGPRGTRCIFISARQRFAEVSQQLAEDRMIWV